MRDKVIAAARTVAAQFGINNPKHVAAIVDAALEVMRECQTQATRASASGGAEVENRCSHARARDVITLRFDHLTPEAKDELLNRLANMPTRFVIEPTPRATYEVIADCEARGVEHITHVAIYFRERAWSLTWPCRHCHVLDMLRQFCDGCPYDFGRHQGFLTNTGRYVSREEAAEIARAAGQTTSTRSELFSEDLW